MLDTLESLALDTETALAALALDVLREEKVAERVREEEKRLAARRRSFEKIIERKTHIIKKYMLKINSKKIKTDLVDIVLRQSESVEILSEVPTEFCRVKLEPDLKTIKERIKSGEALNFARVNINQNVGIK
jgi:uncharacterized radical SAM superfamily protein